MARAFFDIPDLAPRISLLISGAVVHVLLYVLWYAQIGDAPPSFERMVKAELIVGGLEMLVVGGDRSGLGAKKEVRRMTESVFIEDPAAGLCWVVEPSSRATAIGEPGSEPLELSREDMELLAPDVLAEARRRGLAS